MAVERAKMKRKECRRGRRDCLHYLMGRCTNGAKCKYTESALTALLNHYTGRASRN